MARRYRSRAYYRKGSRKLKLTGSSFSPREEAALLKHWHKPGATYHGAGDAVRRARQSWRPKRGRRKLGARRKLTVVESVWRYIKVPNLVRKRSRRR